MTPQELAVYENDAAGEDESVIEDAIEEMRAADDHLFFAFAYLRGNVL